jgi:hypothetical protein
MEGMSALLAGHRNIGRKNAALSFLKKSCPE